jgi:hypothetical protein
VVFQFPQLVISIIIVLFYFLKKSLRSVYVRFVGYNLKSFALSLCLYYSFTNNVSCFGRCLHFIVTCVECFIHCRPQAEAKGNVRSSAMFFFYFTLCKSIAVTKFVYFFPIVCFDT